MISLSIVMLDIDPWVGVDKNTLGDYFFVPLDDNELFVFDQLLNRLEVDLLSCLTALFAQVISNKSASLNLQASLVK